MDYINLLGLTAGCLTTVSFLPQVVKTWKSRSADDISSGMFALFSAGVLLWLLYGLELGALPIIIANTITLTKTHTKHTHKNRKQHKQPKRRRPRVHPSLFLPRRIEEGEARVAHAVRDLRQRRGIKQMQSRNRVLHLQPYAAPYVAPIAPTAHAHQRRAALQGRIEQVHRRAPLEPQQPACESDATRVVGRHFQFHEAPQRWRIATKRHAYRHAGFTEFLQQHLIQV